MIILWFSVCAGLINHDWFVSRFLGNTIWLMALCYYVYITFLGYNCECSNKNGNPVRSTKSHTRIPLYLFVSQVSHF